MIDLDTVAAASQLRRDIESDLEAARQAERAAILAARLHRVGTPRLRRMLRVTITVDFNHDDVAARFGIHDDQVPQFARAFADDVAALIRVGGPDPVITCEEKR